MPEGEQGTPIEEQVEFQEVSGLTFDQVRRGSEFLIFTGNTPEEVKDRPDYKIQVTGIRKNGLLVTVEPAYHGMGGDFTARMPGVIKGAYPDTPEWFSHEPLGVAEGELRVADEQIAYKLYMENLKDLEGERMSKSMSTSPIRKILFKQ